jgi:pimeloyl-ACP methyl ester carboxylesterase
MMTSTDTGTHLVETPQGRIAYSSIGAGPLVVLSHGMGDLRESFRAVAPMIAEAGYRAVSVDLRGHGDSDATFASYGDAETATDLLALLDHLDAGPATIVGSSMSAGAAVIAAAERPDAVKALVLTGPFVRNPGASPIARTAQRLMFRVLMARPWGAAVWRAYLPSLFAGRRPEDLDDYLGLVAAALRRPGRARAFSLTTRTDHAPAEARLSEVRCPVLVVMGDQDPDFRDPLAEGQWISEQLDAKLLMVPEAGHYPHAQRPDLVAAAVIEFLDAVVPRA